MATYDIYDLDETTDFLASLYVMLMPDANVARGSDNWLRIRALAAGIVDTHANGLALYRAVWPQTAPRESLLLWAELLDITVKGATTSSGTDVLRVRGTVGGAGGAVAIGNTLVHASGLQFQINEAQAVAAGAFVDVSVVSVDTGLQVNLEAGEILTFSPTLSGIDADAELQGDLANGEDEESTGSLRRRILEALAAKGKGGSDSDWRQWVLAQTGLAEAYAYRGRGGFGAVDIVGMKKGVGSARFLNGTERSALLAALEELRPTGVPIRVLECVEDAQPVKVTVTASTGEKYARDWNDETPLTTSSYTDASRLLVFTTDRPSDMRAGDRVTWDAAVGESVEIESLNGTNGVVLKTAVGAIAGGTLIYSGGPLCDSIRTAVRAMADGYDEVLDNGDTLYHDGIGPAKGVHGGSWDDSLRPLRVLGAAADVEGALDVDVDSPAATYTPTDYQYPDDAQVPVVTISYVFVKYA